MPLAKLRLAAVDNPSHEAGECHRNLRAVNDEAPQRDAILNVPGKGIGGELVVGGVLGEEVGVDCVLGSLTVKDVDGTLEGLLLGTFLLGLSVENLEDTND